MNYLQADNSKAKKELGWVPKTEMKQSARLMVEADLKNWSRYLDGEMFPWDAPFNMNESKLVVRGLRA